MLANLFLFSLLAFSASAEPHAALGHVNRHHDIAKRVPGDVDIHKRVTGARFSFYDVGLGACGTYSQPNDFMVALNSIQYGGGYPGPQCFKTITISYNGKSAQATILDECLGCPDGGLDLSRGLFNYFASEDAGIIYGEWHFNDGNGGGATTQQPTTTYQEPTTSTSQWTPTTTWTPEPTTSTSSWTPTTTWTPETTSTWSSTSSSWSESSSSSSWSSSSEWSSSADSSSVVSSSAAPSASSTPGGIVYLNQAYVGFGDLLLVAAQVGAN